MVARQVHPRFRDQRYQSGYKIQWIEDHVGRSIPIRRLQLVAYLTVLRQRQTLVNVQGQSLTLCHSILV